MRLTAFAKVNLYLHVVGRRADGYHLLDSLITFADIGDEIAIAPSEDLTLDIDGPFAGALGAGDNLMLDAARALAAAAGRPPSVALRLTKRLPVAAGLGGGSADAAAVLRGLNEVWQLGLSVPALQAIGIGLGADVPACLEARSIFIGGVGDEIVPAPALPPLAVLLVNPGVAVATADVFAALPAADDAPGRFAQSPSDAAAVAALLAQRQNGLEAPARRLAPVIGDVLDLLSALPDVLLARMSGSGATCFALFDDITAAHDADVVLRRRKPDWWTAVTRLGAAA